MSAEKTLEELQETHSEMLATAVDIGLEVPDELKADFTDPGAGATIVSNLDALIREHRQKNGVAAEDEVRQNAPPKKVKKTKATKTKKPAPRPEPAEQKKEDTTVASKPAKKTAKKTAAKKSASANARTRVSFAEDAKISRVAGKENPAKKGSGKAARIDNVLRHNGKTVKTYLTTGKGKSGTLGWCVKSGLVKVS